MGLDHQLLLNLLRVLRYIENPYVAHPITTSHLFAVRRNSHTPDCISHFLVHGSVLQLNIYGCAIFMPIRWIRLQMVKVVIWFFLVLHYLLISLLNFILLIIVVRLHKHNAT